MAFIHGKSVSVLHGIYDLSAFLNEASTARQVDTAETTTFGASGGGKTYITGLKDGTLSCSGLFDGSASAIDAVLTSSLGSDSLSPVIHAPEGFAVGSRVSVLQAKTTSYQVSSPVGDVVSVSYDAQADGGIDAGVSLCLLASVSATTNTSSHDNTASTANGGLAQLHVTANTRTVSTVFKVQHSADNSTWADLATFTTVATVITTSERVAVASGTTVNRYLRAQATLSAGTGSITYQISFSRR